jgi:hypothetical protein
MREREREREREKVDGRQGNEGSRQSVVGGHADQHD